MIPTAAQLTFEQSNERDDADAARCQRESIGAQLEEIGEHYGRYRLHVPETERAMAKSLEHHGQLSPEVVRRRGERYELIDGFKRLGAARHLTQVDHLPPG